ncbi:hypothetical protein [Planotetraspora sp. GP83]|uniref:hypothetical protein n=1 Tax=Planotetraspora sp. GP83 TaxID=3156264 RepID=UPI003512B4CB
MPDPRAGSACPWHDGREAHEGVAMEALLAIGTRKGLFLARSSGGGPFEVDPVCVAVL